MKLCILASEKDPKLFAPAFCKVKQEMNYHKSGLETLKEKFQVKYIYCYFINNLFLLCMITKDIFMY